MNFNSKEHYRLKAKVVFKPFPACHPTKNLQNIETLAFQCFSFGNLSFSMPFQGTLSNFNALPRTPLIFQCHFQGNLDIFDASPKEA